MDLTLQILKSIFNTSLVAVSVLKAVRNPAGHVEDFEIIFVNNELERQTRRSDLVGKKYAEEYPGIKETGVYNALLRVSKSGKPRQLEYYYKYEGFDNWFQCMFVKINDGIVATNLDITNRKLAELKAKTIQSRRNTELYNAAISAQEKERRRIAESIHNGLGQVLFAVKLGLDSMKFDGNLDLEKLSKIRTNTLNLLNDAIRDTRRVSHELSPIILEDFGLKAAIKDVCEQFRTIVDISLNYQGPVQLGCSIELPIYRMVQELIHNMGRHSKATRCIVNVEVLPAAVHLSVEDNGSGFSESPRGGLGLATLKNQIKIFGGTMVINSTPAAGTKIELTIPYN